MPVELRGAGRRSWHAGLSPRMFEEVSYGLRSSEAAPNGRERHWLSPGHCLRTVEQSPAGAGRTVAAVGSCVILLSSAWLPPSSRPSGVPGSSTTTSFGPALARSRHAFRAWTSAMCTTCCGTSRRRQKSASGPHRPRAQSYAGVADFWRYPKQIFAEPSSTADPGIARSRGRPRMPGQTSRSDSTIALTHDRIDPDASSGRPHA